MDTNNLKSVNMKTPLELGFRSTTEHLLDILNYIKKNVENNVYEFKPFKPFKHYNGVVNSETILNLNLVLKTHGWYLESKWYGSKDGGYSVWVIKPLNP